MLYKFTTVTTTMKPHLLFNGEFLKLHRGLFSCSYFGFLHKDISKRKESLHVKYCAFNKSSYNLYSNFNKSCISVAKLEMKPVNNFQIRKQSDGSHKNSIDHIRSQKYDPLYLLEHIGLLRVIGFAARISAVVFALGCPISSALYFSETIMPDTALTVVGLTAINTLLFLVPSILLTSRVVGKIMISEDGKYLKISHMSIFGKRRDIYVRPQDLILKKIPVKTIMKIVKFQNSTKWLIFLPYSGTQNTELEILHEIFQGKNTDK